MGQGSVVESKGSRVSQMAPQVLVLPLGSRHDLEQVSCRLFSNVKKAQLGDLRVNTCIHICGRMYNLFWVGVPNIFWVGEELNTWNAFYLHQWWSLFIRFF